MSSMITGGTGFIGSQVVRHLLEKGEKNPVVFDISLSKNRLDDVADQIEMVKGDLGNFNHVLNTVKKARPKVIYHMGLGFGMSLMLYIVGLLLRPIQ